MDTGVLSQVSKRGHEQVVFFHYPAVGLKAIVAIHSTALGPALGGCRIRPYENEARALDDVLRLSEGMTYKSSLAGLDLGGGKSCLIADPEFKEGRKELFLQFGRAIDSLSGRYITAEDMGTSVPDMMVVRECTKHVSGLARESGGSGDPSPWTAMGVFRSIIAACERVFGTKDLNGRTVTVQGVGHVGMFLLDHLVKAGAKVTVSDINSKNIEAAKKSFDVEVCSPEAIYDVACDVYAPCAIGQTVNHDTLKRLKTKIIAGGANNQLIDSSVYSILKEKQVVYCPDFAVNAGGVISCAGEFVRDGWSEPWVKGKVEGIYTTIHRILDEAQKRGKFSEIVALELAKERIHEAKGKKTDPNTSKVSCCGGVC